MKQGVDGIEYTPRIKKKCFETSSRVSKYDEGELLHGLDNCPVICSPHE